LVATGAQDLTVKPNSSGKTRRSALCRHDADTIRYRDKNIVDLIGRETFLSVAYHQILDKELAPNERNLLDAVLIALMEHGLTPSAVSSRLTYTGAPESLQGAVAAGLLGVGDNFVGTMEGCGRLLAAIVADEKSPEEIARNFRTQRKHVPGFGHHIHRSGDPRTTALLALAEENGVARSHVDALGKLATAVDREAGRHIVINATGACAAILGDIGVPPPAMRGFALIARTAGLVAHVVEEMAHPLGMKIWAEVDR
jgi:citrate synthase